MSVIPHAIAHIGESYFRFIVYCQQQSLLVKAVLSIHCRLLIANIQNKKEKNYFIKLYVNKILGELMEYIAFQKVHDL